MDSHYYITVIIQMAITLSFICEFFYMMHHSYPETFFSVYLSSFPESLCVICLECIVLAGKKILIYINTGTITEIFFSLTER